MWDDSTVCEPPIHIERIPHCSILHLRRLPSTLRTRSRISLVLVLVSVRNTQKKRKNALNSPLVYHTRLSRSYSSSSCFYLISMFRLLVYFFLAAIQTAPPRMLRRSPIHDCGCDSSWLDRGSFACVLPSSGKNAGTYVFQPFLSAAPVRRRRGSVSACTLLCSFINYKPNLRS